MSCGVFWLLWWICLFLPTPIQKGKRPTRGRSSPKKVWGAEVIHGKVQEIHASKGRYSIKVQMPDKELVQEFRGGVGTRGPSWNALQEMIELWKAGLQICLFPIHLQKQRPNDWNLEIFPGFGCDSWPRLQGPRMGSMKTKLRAHADSLTGSVNEATSLEIGSVHKILVKFGSI